MIIRLTVLACVLSVTAYAQQPPNCAVGGFVISPDETIWVCKGAGLAPVQMSTGGGAAWGGITGTLANQTDLNNALAAKGTSNFSGAYADLTGKPTLGSAAATASTDYATAAQGVKADSALQPAGNGGSLTGLTKAQVGLSNVDNTSDANKPISTLQQTAFDNRLLTNANAVSATKLLTARAINGVNFDGTAAITVTAAADTLSTATLASGVTSSSLTTLGAAATLTTTGTVGYRTGAGGTVTQATSKATAVTLSKACGAITLNAAALAAAAIVSFTQTNTVASAGDVVIANHTATGTFGAYGISPRAGAGTITWSIRNNSAASLAEAIVISFCVIEGVTS